MFWGSFFLKNMVECKSHEPVLEGEMDSIGMCRNELEQEV